MNEAKIQSNRTHFDGEEYVNAHDHDPRHDLDLNPTDGENGLITSTNEFDSGEHSSAKFPDDDYGGCSQGFNHSTSSEHVNAHLSHNHSEGLEIEKPQLVDFSSSPIPTKEFSPTILGPANPRLTATKGFGLKKWRRIKREITKDGAANPDSIKILKRGSPNLDVKPPSDGDGSVASTNAFVNLFADDTVFTAGPDSDNSDDRSSKSSTAASAPKYRHDTPRLVGFQREKHRVKHLGRNLSIVGIGPRSQAGKGLADSSKKHRGQSHKLEKENPFSCVESDLRSCNSVLQGGSFSGISDQAQSGRSINFEGEDAYDEQTFEEQSAEKLIADCSNSGSLSQDNPCNAKNGNGKNFQFPGDCDPLVNSIQMLQSAQVVLEREVQKFGEMGKGIHILCADSNERDRLSDGWDSEFNHVYLNNNVQTLETQLSEAEGGLKEKDMKIAKLEATIKQMESCRNDIESTIELQHERCQEMEANLDGLLKQKFEAEIEYIVITRSTKEFSVLVEDQIKLLGQQQYLARERTQFLRTLTDVGNEDVMLRGKAEQLETLHRVMEGGENIPKMQKRVVNSAKCFFIQLILLVLVFGLFVLRLTPKSTVVVPT